MNPNPPLRRTSGLCGDVDQPEVDRLHGDTGAQRRLWKWRPL